jgi:hypothetical protein
MLGDAKYLLFHPTSFELCSWLLYGLAKCINGCDNLNPGKFCSINFAYLLRKLNSNICLKLVAAASQQSSMNTNSNYHDHYTASVAATIHHSTPLEYVANENKW